jgi:glycosyltransferase involved in cell wall biosynthesis
LIIYALKILQTSQNINTNRTLKCVINKFLIKNDYFNLLGKPPIALQVDTLDIGGLEQIVYILAIGLSQYFDVYIFIMRGDLGMIAKKLEKIGVKIIIINNDKNTYLSMIKELRIKLINTHYSTTFVKYLDKKKVIIVNTFHNYYTWFDPEEYKKLSKIYNLFDAHICVSDGVKEYSKYKFNLKDNLVTIINGVTNFKLNLYKSNKKYKKRKSFKFVNIASITELKNHNLIVEAANVLRNKGLENFQIYLIGNVLSDSYLSFLKMKISKYKLNKFIKIMGYIDHNNIIDIYYNEADALLMSSLQEGCSNVILESIAIGLPYIITNVGFSKELNKYQGGIIIPNVFKDLRDISISQLINESKSDNPKNLNDLVNSMEIMMDEFDRFRINLIKNKQLIQNEISHDIMVDNYSNLFFNIMK